VLFKLKMKLALMNDFDDYYAFKEKSLSLNIFHASAKHLQGALQAISPDETTKPISRRDVRD